MSIEILLTISNVGILVALARVVFAAGKVVQRLDDISERVLRLEAKVF